jgi:hypothetical protein
MEAEEIIKLFDTCWFGFPNLKEHQSSSTSTKLSRIKTNHTRSMSDQLNMTSFKHDSMSPNSVLFEPKLQTILSGKDVIEQAHMQQLEVLPKMNITRNGRRKRESKSLSDLEFEEVKGFMDLGFVFSEEDKDTNLVTILPGLQRLGKNGEKEEEEDCSAIQRPYLSEAWEIQERRKEEKPLMKWKTPAPTNEVDMKYSLKCWAQNVASTVK